MGLEQILGFLGMKKPDEVKGIPFDLNHVFDDDTVVIRPAPFYLHLPTRTVEDRIYRGMCKVFYYLFIEPQYQALGRELQRRKNEIKG